MPTFLAVYRGRTVAEARMVAVSADPSLVADGRESTPGPVTRTR